MFTSMQNGKQEASIFSQKNLRTSLSSIPGYGVNVGAFSELFDRDFLRVARTSYTTVDHSCRCPLGDYINESAMSALEVRAETGRWVLPGPLPHTAQAHPRNSP